MKTVQGVPSKFNQATDRWFELLVNWATKHSCEPFAKCLGQVSNRLTLDDLCTVIRDQLPVKLQKPLIAHAYGIIAGDFANEFRYRYNTAHGKPLCTQTSEFFSLVRQALYYPEGKLRRAKTLSVCTLNDACTNPPTALSVVQEFVSDVTAAAGQEDVVDYLKREWPDLAYTYQHAIAVLD